MGGSLQNTVSLLSSHVVSLRLNILLAWHALTVLGVDKTSRACNLSRVSKQSFCFFACDITSQRPLSIVKDKRQLEVCAFDPLKTQTRKLSHP